MFRHPPTSTTSIVWLIGSAGCETR
jgi:hypothetical protein